MPALEPLEHAVCSKGGWRVSAFQGGIPIKATFMQDTTLDKGDRRPITATGQSNHLSSDTRVYMVPSLITEFMSVTYCLPTADVFCYSGSTGFESFQMTDDKDSCHSASFKKVVICTSSWSKSHLLKESC